MGHSTSKEAAKGNNPWEAEIARNKRRELNAKERAAELKQIEKQRKRAEKEAKRVQRKDQKKKKSKRKSKLGDLKDTEPPPIVRQSKAKLEDSDYDSEAIRRMKDQLAFNSDIFVLNQRCWVCSSTEITKGSASR